MTDVELMKKYCQQIVVIIIIIIIIIIVIIIIIKAVPRTTSTQIAKERYLEPTISFERCPSISIWTVGHSKTSDKLIGIFSSLHGHFRKSHGSSEINLDPLFPVILLG